MYTKYIQRKAPSLLAMHLHLVHASSESSKHRNMSVEAILSPASTQLRSPDTTAVEVELGCGDTYLNTPLSLSVYTDTNQ